jgi:uncharacterized small protein (DUF1192 family)
MDTDDQEPTEKKSLQKDLEAMSIEALGNYISELETEIERVCGAISLKNTAKSGAESAFKPC